MKFTCTQENLNRGLTVVNHLASKNTTLPILNNVLLKAENGLLELSTTNLEVGVKCQVRGKIEQEGSFTVQARLLSDYVNLLPKQAIDLDVTDQELKVQCEGYKTKMKGISSEDFPLITAQESKGSLKIDIPAFKQALSQVIFAVAMDETRPEISGMLFHAIENKLTLVATDSFRLAQRQVPVDQIPADMNFIVPYKTLQEVNRILGEAEAGDMLTISWSDNQVVFQFGGIELISRLIEGQYPDYQQVIPSSFKTEIILDSKELTQIVKSASLFCRAGINDIHIRFDSNTQKVEVESSNSQVGENKAAMLAAGSGESNDIVFNFRYVLDGLANMNTSKVILKLIDKHNPGLIIPKYEEDDSEGHANAYNYIIMPIKS